MTQPQGTEQQRATEADKTDVLQTTDPPPVRLGIVKRTAIWAGSVWQTTSSRFPRLRKLIRLAAAILIVVAAATGIGWIWDGLFHSNPVDYLWDRLGIVWSSVSNKERLDFLVVALIGVLVGGAEIVARYRDAPNAALTSLPAWLYMLVNAIAAVIALALTRLFEWTFIADAGTTPEQTRWIQVLAAGFGAMLILRSSFFVSSGIGDSDDEFHFGPSSVLRVVLDATDRAIDRKQARRRDDVVKRVLSEVDFEKAHLALPTYVLALLQGMSEPEQLLVGNELGLLKTKLAEADNGIKSRVLGLKIMDFAGPDVLEDAVKSLGSLIRVESLDELRRQYLEAAGLPTTPVVDGQHLE